MDTPVFIPESILALDTAYPENPVLLHHALTDHPLLTRDALIALATTLPKDSVEYNIGKLPIGVNPEDVPPPSLDIANTIRSIDDNGYWMVIKRIEQHPLYAKLLSDILAEIEPLTFAYTGKMMGQEGFIFISSPGAVTPFHFDPEHNILLQLCGKKVMTVFPANDENLVSPQAHEAFHLGQHHRNQPWRDEFAAKGSAFTLTPGDGVYVPVKAPHWVQNGDAVSISLSVTWRSQWSYAEADARAFNHVLRGVGLNPKSPGRYPAQNLGKSYAYRALRKMRSKMPS